MTRSAAVAVLVWVLTPVVCAEHSPTVPTVVVSPVATVVVSPATSAAARRTPVAIPEVGALDLERLRSRRLAFPVPDVDPSTIRDSFAEMRGAHRHEATDIVALRGAAVVAVDDGTVTKLFTSIPGGLTIYQFDRDAAYCYYYAHLDRYADGVREGVAVRRGDLLGYVGTSGDARDVPHLHFAIFKLAPERRWWEGTPIDPYPLLRTEAPPRTP